MIIILPSSLLSFFDMQNFVGYSDLKGTNTDLFYLTQQVPVTVSGVTLSTKHNGTKKYSNYRIMGNM